MLTDEDTQKELVEVSSFSKEVFISPQRAA